MSGTMKILNMVATVAILHCALAGAADKRGPTAATTEPVPQQEVTVTANRIELEKRVSKYVYQIATVENGEGISRWRKPVCPLVAGIPQQEGEFTLERISEIARTAGIPLADEHCRANLLIFVTRNTQQFFSGMTTRTRLMTFAGAHPSVVDEFIKTPRPVRVWYKTAMFTPEGESLGDTDRTDIAERAYGIPRVSPDTSYARISAIWGMARVLVVVDQGRLQGVSRGQFADYVGMVSLAQIRPSAKLGDAPTILKLFDGAPQAAPDGMSEWDQAFLKSVYATESTSKGQRGAIQHGIMRDMTH
jgi:hypothetical protein